MKHPIYKSEDDRKMMYAFSHFGRDNLYEKLQPTFIAAGQSDNEAKAFINRIGTLVEIENGGCNLIQLKDADHWNESLSEKTLKKMSVADIKMPYPAFTIDLTNADWSTYEYVHVLDDKHYISFMFETKEDQGTRYFQMQMDHDQNVESEVDQILDANYGVQRELKRVADLLGKWDDDEAEEFFESKFAANKTSEEQAHDSIYKVISIIMFTSMFQKEADRVQIHKVANKGSKKRIMPDHTTTITYLSQPTYTLTGKAATGDRKGSDKTWMQRGHFRRQPYGKRDNPMYKEIWIDAMWKGKGSKILERVIKV